MREKLMKLARQMPVVPFMLELSGGRKIRVRSSDHNVLGAEKGSFIVLLDDHGLSDLLPVHHIIALTSKEPA